MKSTKRSRLALPGPPRSASTPTSSGSTTSGQVHRRRACTGGRESLIQLFERVVETWEYIRPEPHSIERLDDGRYRVKGDLRVKHRTSDTEIGAPYEQHLELRDLLLVKGEMKSGEIAFA